MSLDGIAAAQAGDLTLTTEGKLVLAWGGFECRLEHFEANQFRVTEGGGFFEDRLVPFTVKDGKVARVKFSDQQFERK